MHTMLHGGFRYGANRMKSVWGGPRSAVRHGVHRYMFQVVALSEVIDVKEASPIATRVELEREIMGKVVARGMWIGDI